MRDPQRARREPRASEPAAVDREPAAVRGRRRAGMLCCVVEPRFHDRTRRLGRLYPRAAARVARRASAGVRHAGHADHSRHLRSRPSAARRRGKCQPGIEGGQPERTRRLVARPNATRAHRRRTRPVRRPAGRMRTDRAKPVGTLRERERLRARPVARDRIGCRARVRASADEVARGTRACPRNSRRRISRVVLASADPRRTAAVVQRRRPPGGRPRAGTAGRRHSDQP